MREFLGAQKGAQRHSQLKDLRITKREVRKSPIVHPLFVIVLSTRGNWK